MKPSLTALVLRDMHEERCSEGHAHEDRLDPVEHLIRRVLLGVVRDAGDVVHRNGLLKSKWLMRAINGGRRMLRRSKEVAPHSRAQLLCQVAAGKVRVR